MFGQISFSACNIQTNNTSFWVVIEMRGAVQYLLSCFPLTYLSVRRHYFNVHKRINNYYIILSNSSQAL